MAIRIISTGGAASTYLRDFYEPWLDNSHSPHSTEGIGPDDRIVYLAGHPVDVVLSFARRGYLFHMIRELRGPDVWESLRDERYPGRGIEPDVMSLEDFLEIGVNYYEFRNHYRRVETRAHHLIAVKYDALDGCAHYINRFIGAPYRHIPDIKPRSGPHEELARYAPRLSEILREDINFYNEMSDVLIL